MTKLATLALNLLFWIMFTICFFVATLGFAMLSRSAMGLDPIWPFPEGLYLAMWTIIAAIALGSMMGMKRFSR